MKFNSELISNNFINEDDQELKDLRESVKNLKFQFYVYDEGSYINNSLNIEDNNSIGVNGNKCCEHESPLTTFDSNDSNDVYTDDDFSDDYEDYFDSEPEKEIEKTMVKMGSIKKSKSLTFNPSINSYNGIQKSLSKKITFATENKKEIENKKEKNENSFRMDGVGKNTNYNISNNSLESMFNTSTSSLGSLNNSHEINKNRRKSTHIMESTPNHFTSTGTLDFVSISTSNLGSDLKNLSSSSKKMGNHTHHGHRRSKSCITSSSNKDYYYNIDLIFHKYSIREGDEEQNNSIISNHSLSDLKYINNRTKTFQYFINNNISDLKELTIEKLQSMGFKDYYHQIIPYEEMNEIFKYIESPNVLIRVLVALEFIFYHQNKHNHSHKCVYSSFIAQLFFDQSPVVFYCLTKLSNTYLSEKLNFKYIFQHEKIKDFFNDELISTVERENRINLFKKSGFIYHHGTLKRNKKNSHDFEKKLKKSYEIQRHKEQEENNKNIIDHDV